MMVQGGWIDNLRPSRRPLRALLRMRFFFYAVKNTPHAEEHPKSASGSTQDADAIRFGGGLARVMLALLIALALAGCGKKGGLQPPPDEPNTYPRSYPRE